VGDEGLGLPSAGAKLLPCQHSWQVKVSLRTVTGCSHPDPWARRLNPPRQHQSKKPSVGWLFTLVVLTAHLSNPPDALRRLCEQDIRGLIERERMRSQHSAQLRAVQCRLKSDQVAELGARFGVHTETVRRELHRTGAIIRPGGRPRRS
jgi:hypothetical protein